MNRLMTAFGVLLVAASAIAGGTLDVKVSFSLDGGKTWSMDFPTVKENAELKVRASYTIADEWEDRDIISASFRCAQKFASSTAEPRPGVFMQRDKVYWKSSKHNDKYEWTLDTKGLKPGSHVFLLDIGYWQKGPGAQCIRDDQAFYVTIEGGGE